jgi:hypothetical protein
VVERSLGTGIEPLPYGSLQRLDDFLGPGVNSGSYGVWFHSLAVLVNVARLARHVVDVISCLLPIVMLTFLWNLMIPGYQSVEFVP